MKIKMIWQQLDTGKCLSAMAAGLAGVLLSAGALATGGSDPAGDYADSGPYSTTSHSGGFSCTIYRPSNLDGNHPIILWGNGTGSSTSTYGSGLEHWASWGFVVAAANTSNAGSGEEMLGCLDYLEGSSLSSDLNFDAVGTSGHSQGGGGAIMAGVDSRITATAPMQPYILGLGHDSSSQYQQHSPMLLLSGGSDSIAGPSLNQSPVYSRVSVPVFWGTRDGASHFEPTGDFGDFAGVSTAWFLWQLTGDSEAGDLFPSTCGMCNASGWDIEYQNF